MVLNNTELDRINRILENIWTGEYVWSEFKDALHHALVSIQPGINSADQIANHWLKLPQICCQAAGGDPLWADDLTAAWILFYIAADLMDAVEDEDPPDSWWATSGPGVALNTASGLYFTASLVLNNLFYKEETRHAAGEIAQALYQYFMKMSSGQHLDLTIQEPSLKQCWKIASAKSGAFFSAGSWAGACLATQDPSRLIEFERFGHHLGILIQILDDLEVLKLLQHPAQNLARTEFFHSLAIAYSLEVLPIEKGNRLRDYLRSNTEDPVALSEAWRLIELSGAGLYLRTELSHHQRLALEALHAAQPLPDVEEIIVSLLQFQLV